ncbi:MAG: methionyl-tRNA formyltransferase [Prevotella sp.]|jgi:methionyl-tRNA formyltransferase|nr:methionyl-tRNA formyltransferase [Prevotella sp.]MCH3984550.1 methionyl-tRNA formyltransferase [Prevotella sp.]MCH3991155.1 methionyl-tRNA formyltransferase [Prevotella sp.]MCH4100639.1 methionyl-tRNA formyltransferase [Prevotella sp.]MCH4186158.1 methionyl-tRNA formyltransferase [Prevotella sp.]MCH4251935.1 methionyl-tRNA formyltransferase [Prevotella sp.]
MDKKDLRIVFMGTPEFAVGTLQSLVEEGYPVVAVVTGPDRPVGRHQDRLQAPAVKVYAEAHHLPVLQPEKLKNPEFLGQLAAFNANLQIVVAFRMLPEEVWAMPEYGTFNVHAALLPQYRGAAPINWAVINGETETGVTTFFIDKKIDTGRIILQKHLPIGVDDNVEKVYDGLEKLGAETALETIQKILRGNGKAESIPQSEMLKTVGPLKAAPKIHKDTCRIDWHQTAKHIHDFVRGLSPVPGAWTTVDGQMMKIFQARLTDIPVSGDQPGSLFVDGKHLYAAGNDLWVEILELQPAGKRRMNAADFVNGNRQLSQVAK